jgi:dTDP-4-amino-4,6-dideoxygalactose transaminase
MTDIQAALGLSQLNRLDAFVDKRHNIVAAYEQHLSLGIVTTPWQHPDAYSAYHLYVIQLKLEVLQISHRQAFDFMKSSGVGVNLHYIPLYKQPYYQQFGYDEADFPNAEHYYATAISLPIYPDLIPEQQAKVIQLINSLQ